MGKNVKIANITGCLLSGMTMAIRELLSIAGLVTYSKIRVVNQNSAKDSLHGLKTLNLRNELKRKAALEYLGQNWLLSRQVKRRDWVKEETSWDFLKK